MEKLNGENGDATDAKALAVVAQEADGDGDGDGNEKDDGEDDGGDSDADSDSSSEGGGVRNAEMKRNSGDGAGYPQDTGTWDPNSNFRRRYDS